MSRTKISEDLRAHIRLEARDRCGYCQTQQKFAYASLEVEHIVPVAEGGSTKIENLWLACRPCNLYKGKQTKAVDPQTGRLSLLFNPRQQIWGEHFQWSENGVQIIGLTSCGRATVEALNLNSPFAIETRRHWVSVGWHPPEDM